MTVAVTFLAGWAVVAALVVLVVPLPLPGATPLALLALTAAALMVSLSIWRPGLLARIQFPPLKAMGAIVALTFIDTAFAGAALWVLLPEGTQIAPVIMIAAFIVALGAGLVCGTPGGVGPFEMTLLALLPHVPEEPVLAAVLAFRAVYYAAPALIGAAVVIRGPRAEENTPDPALEAVQGVEAPALSPRLDAALAQAPRAEANLLRHGCLSLFTSPGAKPAALTAPVGQSLVFLSDPLSRDIDEARFLSDARDAARARFLTPLLYKSGARIAAAARRAGWATLPLAREAWLDPAGFTTDGASCRQLRRKLRKADTAGVVISTGSALPLAEMDTVARAWADARGGERGFSMGIWDPATLPWSRVFLARRDGKLIGFLTLHANGNEWTLDLMRQLPEAPDGTMHLLLTRAIAAAGEAGVPRLSLAAVPLGKQAHEPELFHRLRDRIDRISGAKGLRQFKTCFGPNWEVLYITAPTRTGLMLGALDVMREISAKRGQGLRAAPFRDVLRRKRA
jgi:phosphatidylglycerol lysyltransferase